MTEAELAAALRAVWAWQDARPYARVLREMQRPASPEPTWPDEHRECPT